MFKVINPVQLTLHELYFDLTPIRTVHRKNPIIISKSYTFELIITEEQTYCHAFLSACDELLVPIRGQIHRDIVIHDY